MVSCPLWFELQRDSMFFIIPSVSCVVQLWFSCGYCFPSWLFLFTSGILLPYVNLFLRPAFGSLLWDLAKLSLASFSMDLMGITLVFPICFPFLFTFYVYKFYQCMTCTFSLVPPLVCFVGFVSFSPWWWLSQHCFSILFHLWYFTGDSFLLSCSTLSVWGD